MKDQAEKLRSLVRKAQSGSQESRSWPVAGECISLIVNEGIYKGAYESEVLEVGKASLMVKMPRQNGKLVFMPVGTIVHLVNGSEQIAVEVLQRRFSPVATIVCSLPGNISLANEAKHARVISVTSGKGGVGKTNLTVNLALAAQTLGQKVAILDADLGLANVDIILGLYPDSNLTHVLLGEKRLQDIISYGPNKLPVIAGGSGIAELANLPQWQVSNLINSLNELEELADVIFIDTGAGLSRQVLSFLQAATEVIVVTTPEPTSLTDGYAVIKLLSQKRDCLVSVLVNRARNQAEADATFRKMSSAANDFLNYHIKYLGWVPDDQEVVEAVKRQRPFLLEYPSSAAARSVQQIAQALFNVTAPQGNKNGLRSLFQRLTKLFEE